MATGMYTAAGYPLMLFCCFSEPGFILPGLPGQPLLGLPHNRAGTYGAASRNLSMGNAPSLNTADGSASVAGAAPAQVGYSSWLVVPLMQL
jgi:hypothetical protein